MAQTDQIDKFLRTVQTAAGSGVPVRRQGSLTETEPFPSLLVTYWVNSTETHAHYSDAAYGTQWSFDVNVYGRDPGTVYSTLESIRIALLSAGYAITGKGYDTTSDEPEIVGRTLEALFLEIE